MAKWKLDRISPDPQEITTSNNDTFTYDFPENGTTSTEYKYKITYTSTDGCTGETTVTIPTGRTCSCPCVCNDLTITNTTLTLGAAQGSTANTTFTFDCEKGESVITVASKPDWADVSINNGVITITALQAGSETEIKTGNLMLKVCDETCNTKVITVKQEKPCEWTVSNGIIQIMIDGSVFARHQGYDAFALTDEQVGVNCTDWVLDNGAKYNIYELQYGVVIAEYVYEDCEYKSMRAGSYEYCDIQTPPGNPNCQGAENKVFQEKQTYYLYGLKMENRIADKLEILTFPDDNTAQSQADSSHIYHFR